MEVEATKGAGVATKVAEVATKGVSEEAIIIRVQEALQEAAAEEVETGAGMEATSLKDQAHSHPGQWGPTTLMRIKQRGACSGEISIRAQAI